MPRLAPRRVFNVDDGLASELNVTHLDKKKKIEKNSMLGIEKLLGQIYNSGTFSVYEIYFGY